RFAFLDQAKESSMASAKSSAPRIVDGNRQRCLVCGHPRKEHRGPDCSVPKCPCVDYTQRGIKANAEAG
ncbi:MAG TPA: hypothetical protein VFY15_00135, partial [Acidimicrobiia bacterium]|nr:hypothetical protein [Acidimicrobiia bacterium]